MRYAIVSDIHANLEALRAVLKDIKSQRVDKVICLGDIVGYYADPNTCTELCRNSGFICIRGNHDDAALELCDIDDFNPIAQTALLWTAKKLKQEHKDWLRKLPEFLIIDEQFLAVHGSPWDPYAYIFSSGGALQAFSCMRNNHPSITLCFFGHTHQRALYATEERAVQEIAQGTHYTLSDYGLFLINPGSVGQSRDGKPGASYIIYSSKGKEIEFRHVPYKIELTQRKVAAAKLPMMLAERLSLGY
ncbi:MAG TPA: metallophosphoesterase family protein [Syntrophomonadaceae bacterium]|nr:metallophosphoesterase family protein [Syntrophomonadaceae bacterium]